MIDQLSTATTITKRDVDHGSLTLVPIAALFRHKAKVPSPSRLEALASITAAPRVC